MTVQAHTQYSEIALDHAQNAHNYGSLSDFNGHARITGPCGDTMEFWLQIEEDVVRQIGFTTDGCASSHACGSMTTELALNHTITEVLDIHQENVLHALGDFPEASAHCALLATNTLHAACKDYSDNQNLMRIRNKIVVLSGKGGVGKSTIAVNYAVSLMQEGKRVGLLDVDIHGPSIPTMLGLENIPLESGTHGLIPVDWKGIKVMSIGFLLQSPDDAVIWRGPRKSAVIKEFLRDVDWGDLDYLIIDSPPGTGDELLSVFQLSGEIRGAIVVTTPQKIAAVDARKSITFCHQSQIPVLGVIENMNGFTCPKCGEITEIFPAGAGRRIAEEMKIPYLGSIPMDLRIARKADEGMAFVIQNPQDFATQHMNQIFKQIHKENT
jgi:ATP-binding protein involved in chromosome partitioning